MTRSVSRSAVSAGAEPPEPPQDLRDVRAEHAAVAVALVDHDVAQALEEPRPPGVRRQQRAVQHVGVGQHEVRVRAHPVALGGRGVPVERRRAELRHGQRAHRAELVHRQRLRRREVERRRLRVLDDGGDDRHEVRERLAGRGARRDDDVPPLAGMRGGGDLVLVRRRDPGHGEPVHEQRRDPAGPVGRASLARRNVLDVRDLPRVPGRRGEPPEQRACHPSESRTPPPDAPVVRSRRDRA